MESHLSIIISALTLIGLLIGFGDKIFRRGAKEKGIVDKVAKIEEDNIALNKKIDQKNEEVNKCIGGISEDIKKIKENHLAHIQVDINNINVKMERIETTLEFIKNK